MTRVHLSGAEESVPWLPYPLRKRVQREIDGVDLLKKFGAPASWTTATSRVRPSPAAKSNPVRALVLPPTTTLAEATQS